MTSEFTEEATTLTEKDLQIIDERLAERIGYMLADTDHRLGQLARLADRKAAPFHQGAGRPKGCLCRPWPSCSL